MNSTEKVSGGRLNSVAYFTVLELVCIVIIALNVFVIKVVKNNKRFQSATFVFLANQAASDILYAIANSIWPFVCHHDVAHPTAGFRPAQLTCEITSWLLWVGYVLSPCFLAAVAFERFAALFFPYRDPIKPKPIAIALWSICLVMQFLFVIDYRTVVSFTPTSTNCFQSFPELSDISLVRSLIAMKLSIFVCHWIPFILVGVFSFAIIVKVLTLKSVGLSNSRQEEGHRKKMKVVYMTLLIIFVYYFVTAPLTYPILMSMFSSKRPRCTMGKRRTLSLLRRVLIDISWLAYISNPIILILFNDHLRQQFKRIVCCRRAPQAKDNSTSASMSTAV